MALTVPVVPDSGAIANADGVEAILGFYNGQERFNQSVKAIVDGTILRLEPLLVEFVDDKIYTLFRNAPWPFEILSITSISSSGTATATGKINSTSLGGTANSVSSSQQVQSHSSSNVGAIGDSFSIEFSSNSACEMASISVVMAIPLR